MKLSNPIRRQVILTGADVARLIAAGFFIGLSVGALALPHIAK